jgi:hypothetical protein
MPERELLARTAHQTWRDALRARRVWFDRPFEKDEKAWLRAADFVVARKMDIVRFVTAQIDAINDPAVLQTADPTTVFASRNAHLAQARYEKVIPTATVDLYRHSHATMLTQLAAFKRRLVPRVYAGVDQLLIDPGLPFSAWFRVLLATAGSEGYDHIMKCYLEQAKEEIVLDPALYQFLKEVASEYEYDLGRFGWSL